MGMESEPKLALREKSPLLEKFSPEEYQTHDAASSRTANPTHYQKAILARGYGSDHSWFYTSNIRTSYLVAILPDCQVSSGVGFLGVCVLWQGEIASRRYMVFLFSQYGRRYNKCLGRSIPEIYFICSWKTEKLWNLKKSFLGLEKLRNFSYVKKKKMDMALNCKGARLTLLPLLDRLIGLVVKTPARERKISGSNPACAEIFPGSSHTSDLKIGTPVVTLPGAWCYRVSAGTGWPYVSILWLGEMESLIGNFYLCVAAHKLVWAGLSLRYIRMLLGR